MNKWLAGSALCLKINVLKKTAPQKPKTARTDVKVGFLFDFVKKSPQFGQVRLWSMGQIGGRYVIFYNKKLQYLDVKNEVRVGRDGAIGCALCAVTGFGGQENVGFATVVELLCAFVKTRDHLTYAEGEG
jgi:hypothetical protein